MHRILMIDNDPDMVALGKLILEREGYFQVIPAHDGQKGLEILNRERDIDLILLDIMMLGMNGWKVLEALKKSGSHIQPPTVILTAYHFFAADKTRALPEVDQFDDYILKPFVVSELLDKINDAVRYRQVVA